MIKKPESVKKSSTPDHPGIIAETNSLEIIPPRWINGPPCESMTAMIAIPRIPSNSGLCLGSDGINLEVPTFVSSLGSLAFKSSPELRYCDEPTDQKLSQLFGSSGWSTVVIACLVRSRRSFGFPTAIAAASQSSLARVPRQMVAAESEYEWRQYIPPSPPSTPAVLN